MKLIWKSIRKRSHFLFVIFCLLSFWLLPCGTTFAAVTSEEENTPLIMMQQETRNKLLTLLTEQQNDLMTLKVQLSMLEKSGTVSQQKLAVVANQLRQAQKKSDELQTALINANQSLKSARAEIGKLQQSLAALQVQVKALQTENKQLKRENKLLKFSMLVAGSGLVCYMANH